MNSNSNATARSRRWQRWTDTAHLITYLGVVAILSILALVLVVAAQGKAAAAAKTAAAAQTRAAAVSTEQARLAKVQADQADRQSKLLRDAICGTFRDVASSPADSAKGPLGRKLIADTGHGADVAQCPAKP